MKGLYEQLTEQQETILAAVRKIAREKIAPRSAEIDAKAEFPWDIMEAYRKSGIMALPIPEKYGGGGAGELLCAMVLEEIAKVDSNAAHALASHFMGCNPILLGGTEAQKKRFLPKFTDKIAAFALTEAEAGSDISAIKTTAVLKGKEYVLNGEKNFSTDGDVASFLTLLVRTNPHRTRGLSAITIDKATAKGLTIGGIGNQMGMRGTHTCHVLLNECHVPGENLLGKEGSGFKLAMMALDRSRPTNAAMAVGIADGALTYAINYAKGRKQFGQPVSEFQGIQWMMADMATEIEAARQLVYKATYVIDHGGPDSKLSAMAKCFASDVAVKVTNDAMQILGGYGYMKDFPLEQKMRDARVFQIVEGTNQIQRVVVARNLLA